MRPTLGGAGKVVPPPKQTTGTMGLIMPVYTAGIVILFTYTVMKVIYSYIIMFSFITFFWHEKEMKLLSLWVYVASKPIAC